MNDNRYAKLWSNRHKKNEGVVLSPLEIEQIRFEERQDKWNSFKQSVMELEKILREGGFIKPCDQEENYQEENQTESLGKLPLEHIKRIEKGQTLCEAE